MNIASAPYQQGGTMMSNKRDHEEPELTQRECTVLALVAQGLSAKEVALALDIAPRTVEKHIDHVRLKIRAKNRAHMVAQAIAKGLLDHPGGNCMRSTSSQPPQEGP